MVAGRIRKARKLATHKGKKAAGVGKGRPKLEEG